VLPGGIEQGSSSIVLLSCFRRLVLWRGFE
jgi:hypothetical protein